MVRPSGEAAGSAAPPVLEVRDLRVTYPGRERSVVAVDRVSFSIGPGEVLGLAGESGSGKSTIANAVLRLLRPPAEMSAGALRFKGRDVPAMSPRELRAFRWREVAMVFQSAMNALNPVLTVGEQIADVFTTHEGLKRRQAYERAGELLELVSLPRARLAAYPHQLSGGMRQRVVIAMAVALRPSLLIMDEPTTALDVVVQQEIMAQIAGLQRELGFSVLFITHDMSLMVELSDRIGVMYGGRLVELADAGELFARPRHPYTASLIDAFPPLTGPRRGLSELSEAERVVDGVVVGCGFHARCPADRANCSFAIPDLREAAPGHWVAEVPVDQQEGAAR
ncbi:ABC transporter ATP-binding protein [Streptomyces sp. NBC_01803]|uniref:ABC transporter ATP-binding protein n=1 Tax=Streptomyces sp. NBC_01803 TaxID=2975946 RepID=UPI002DD79E87|nr:ABC transporter ATP-binding protein [Streptomyces sp. NBC_01803]WSA46967.1 ABC transporter ATP-binding protein [Streptomyces sp. NBC_01803]